MMSQKRYYQPAQFSAYLSNYWQLMLLGSIALLGSVLGNSEALAQVTGDTLLPAGETTTVNFTGVTYEITGGATRARNLFHSFDTFSLSTGETALFNHAPSIETILGRVTGGTISNIDGTIQTPDNSIADIFFLNPQGIVFGPNATLDINGSFIVSTAEQLVFADGTEFTVTNSPSAMLTVSRPSGLILGDDSGRIENQSVAFNPNIDFFTGLEVQSGQSLILASNGIDINSGGTLTAFSGQIDLVSLAPGSSVGLSPGNGISNSGWRLDNETLEKANFQDIQLSEFSFVDTSGDFDDNPNGALRLWGKQILLTDNSGLININFGTSQGGDITITASESLRLDESNIFLFTFSDGDAGNLTLNVADGVIDLDNSGLFAESGSFDTRAVTGDAGTLTINTASLSVKNGSRLSTATFGDGRGGNLIVNALGGSIEVVGTSQDNNGDVDQPSLLVSTTEGSQAAGDIQINTGTLLVKDGGQITSSTFGSGSGGNTLITATDAVTITGETGEASSQIFSSTGDPGALNPALITGDAGSFEIITERLTVQDGGRIFTSTDGPGQGGLLRVQADEVVLSGQGSNPSALLARTESTGDSGQLVVVADSLLVEAGARIDIGTDEDALEGNEAITLGAVKDGNIIARTVTLNDGQIIAESLTGDGGNLNFTVEDYILLRNNSLISATAGTAGTGGTGGNIIIDAASGIVVAIPEENSDIRANAFEGRGGNVIITAQGLLGIERRETPTALSDITASSQLGIDGTVEINTLAFIPSPERIVLPTEFFDTSQLLAQGCEQLSAGSTNQGEFFISERGGVSPLVSNVLGSDEIIDDLRLLETWDSTGPLTEAQGWYRSDANEVILTAIPLPERNRCQS